MKTICIYCGSNPGVDPRFAQAARDVGSLLARTGRTLVYGGGRVGLMGELADAVVAGGGKAIGVIPRILAQKEIAHDGLTQLHVVGSMHERKALMAELSDGFLTLPGGIGTLEELFETWTWGQLGLHQKPIGLLNVAGFFDPLLTFLDQAMAQRFLRSAHRDALLVGDTPEELFTRMDAFQPAPLTKWLNPETT